MLICFDPEDPFLGIPLTDIIKTHLTIVKDLHYSIAAAALHITKKTKDPSPPQNTKNLIKCPTLEE